MIEPMEHLPAKDYGRLDAAAWMLIDNVNDAMSELRQVNPPLGYTLCELLVAVHTAADHLAEMLDECDDRREGGAA